MWDLFVSVPDNCLSFYFKHFDVDAFNDGFQNKLHFSVLDGENVNDAYQNFSNTFF